MNPRVLPFLFGAASLLFFLACLPERLYGDDVWFVHCIVRDQPFPRHYLYMPLARLAAGLGARFELDPFLSLRLLSASGAAFGAACLVASAQRRGASAPGAGLLGALVVTAPTCLFFATAAEIHAPHLAAVGLLAWALSRLHARSSQASVLLVWLVFGLLVCGTHKSGILYLPGTLACYLLLTCGRPRDRRTRDLLSLALAGLLAVGFQVLCTRLESGASFDSQDSVRSYWTGLRNRLDGGYGLRDFLAYVSGDAVTPAFALHVAGFGALGLVLRRRRSLGLTALAVLLPYGLFFPIWNYPERGAFYLVTLPVLAALVLWVVLREGGLPWPVVATAAVGAVFRADELQSILGEQVPAWILLAAVLLGVLWRKQAPGSTPRLAWALLLLQLIGTWRNQEHFARETPRLDWARGACEVGSGEESIVLSVDFERLWLLRLLETPWPEPFARTWALDREAPMPRPTSHTYGDPPLPEFLVVLEEKLQAGVAVYIDSSVREFLKEAPRHADILRAIEEHYALEEVHEGGFHAERVVRRRP